MGRFCLNSQNAVFTGGYGGWMINHKLMIGIGGYGLVSRQDGFTADGEVDEANKLHMGYGGLMLEYTFMQNKKIHMTSGLLIGGGAIENGYGADYSDSPGSNFHTVSESTFTAFQPSVNVEANMTNWFRVAVGGGYRLIHGSDIEGLTDKKLSAPSFGVTLKFGKF